MLSQTLTTSLHLWGISRAILYGYRNLVYTAFFTPTLEKVQELWQLCRRQLACLAILLVEIP